MSLVGVLYAAVVHPFLNAGVLHLNSSIFTTEAFTILALVKNIKKMSIHHAVIHTDSLGIVKALKTFKRHKNPLIKLLYSLLCTIYASQQHAVIC